MFSVCECISSSSSEEIFIGEGLERLSGEDLESRRFA